MRLRKLAKLALALICYYSGLVGWMRRFRPRRGIVILAYHRVAALREDPLGMAISPRDFEIQMRYLAAHHTVLSLSAAVDAPGSQALNTVVLSFDDGYADNYTHAFPVLQREGLPAIIFLTATPIEERGHLWYDRLVNSILFCPAGQLDLGDHGGSWPLQTVPQKAAAARALAHQAKAAKDWQRTRALISQLEALCPGSRSLPSAMLTWDQARAMQQGGIEFGAHTMTHPILSALTGAEQREEIEGSRDMIARRLGEPVRFFAFPNGEKDDYTEATIHHLRSTGFRAACTLIPGINDGGDPFQLKRLGIDADHTGYRSFGTKAIFACELAGIFDWLLRRSHRPQKQAFEPPAADPHVVRGTAG
ncbi:MAG TPA: polysaccharide deacetylase family protein [bacterium]|nr:polysaccharide deacetylase family protein [bacterium]HPR88694.1 polysaccharide deacetylase family protein [bacterium]